MSPSPLTPSGITAQAAAASALLRLDAAETIEQAYDAWAELRVEHAAFLLRCAGERRRIDEQGGFLLGAVRAAAGPAQAAPPPNALATTSADDGLQAFLRETEEKLRRAREALESEVAAEAAHFDHAFDRIRAAVIERIAAVSARVKPPVRLLLRSVAGGRTILHVARPGPDEAVLLLFALNGGKAPTRYGYLFDDATDDLGREPPTLYPDEGIANAPEALRPDAARLEEVARTAGTFLPVKGQVPVPLGDAFYRLLQRGPVLELEKRDGVQFRSLLTRDEGERFAGHLLRSKLEGRLELSLTSE